MTPDKHHDEVEKVYRAMFEAVRGTLAKIDLDDRTGTEEHLKFATLCLAGGQNRLDALWEQFRTAQVAAAEAARAEKAQA